MISQYPHENEEQKLRPPVVACSISSTCGWYTNCPFVIWSILEIINPASVLGSGELDTERGIEPNSKGSSLIGMLLSDAVAKSKIRLCCVLGSKAVIISGVTLDRTS